MAAKIARVSERIIEAISCIDEDFVATRTSLFMNASDIRRLGIGLDARLPQNLSLTPGYPSALRPGSNSRVFLAVLLQTRHDGLMPSGELQGNGPFHNAPLLMMRRSYC